MRIVSHTSMECKQKVNGWRTKDPHIRIYTMSYGHRD